MPARLIASLLLGLLAWDAEAFKHASPEDIVALGRRGIADMGVYRAELTSQERVGERLSDPKKMDVTIRTKPFALLAKFLTGPKAGRRILYNEQLRRGDLLVREAGLLGITSVWIGLDSSMLRKETNHRITEIGFGPLLDLIESDLKKGKAFGGHTRTDEGFDRAGTWCMTYTAPASATGLYAQRTRFCVDPTLGVPVKIEVADKKGILERYEYNAVRSRQKVDSAFFTPEGAGL